MFAVLSRKLHAFNTTLVNHGHFVQSIGTNAFLRNQEVVGHDKCKKFNIIIGAHVAQCVKQALYVSSSKITLDIPSPKHTTNTFEGL